MDKTELNPLPTPDPSPLTQQVKSVSDLSCLRGVAFQLFMVSPAHKALQRKILQFLTTKFAGGEEL